MILGDHSLWLPELPEISGTGKMLFRASDRFPLVLSNDEVRYFDRLPLRSAPTVAGVNDRSGFFEFLEGQEEVTKDCHVSLNVLWNAKGGAVGVGDEDGSRCGDLA